MALFKRPYINILLVYKAILSMRSADFAVRCLGIFLYIRRNEPWARKLAFMTASQLYQLSITCIGWWFAREAGTNWWHAPLLVQLFGRPNKIKLCRLLCTSLMVGWALVKGLRHAQALDKENVLGR